MCWFGYSHPGDRAATHLGCGRVLGYSLIEFVGRFEFVGGFERGRRDRGEPRVHHSAPVASHRGGPRAGAIRGGAVGSPRWTRMSRIADTSAMKAMTRMSAPQNGHTSESQSRAKNHAPMNCGIERPLPRRRTSGLRKIDGLQRVDYGLSFIPNADAHSNVCHRRAPPSQCGHKPSLAGGVQIPRVGVVCLDFHSSTR